MSNDRGRGEEEEEEEEEEDRGGGDGAVREARGRGGSWNPSRKMPRDFRRGFLAIYPAMAIFFLAKLLLSLPPFLSPFGSTNSFPLPINPAFLLSLLPPSFHFLVLFSALSLCFIFFSSFLLTPPPSLTFFAAIDRPRALFFFSSSSSPPFVHSFPPAPSSLAGCRKAHTPSPFSLGRVRGVFCSSE